MIDGAPSTTTGLESSADADAAVRQLFDRFGDKVYALGLRLCGTREEAEEVVQETFLAAFRNWGQFEGRANPGTWLYTIAYRAARRRLRRRAGEPRRMASLDELLPAPSGAMGVVPESGDDPLANQIRAEGRELVEAAIAELPQAFRVPLILKDIFELPVADVAAVLGIREATVKTRVHRARLRLRAALSAALPKREVPPPIYSKQVCLDLLRAKQEALDRGVAFPVGDAIVCERCQEVFRTLDLTRSLCGEIASGRIPEPVRELVLRTADRRRDPPDG